MQELAPARLAGPPAGRTGRRGIARQGGEVVHESVASMGQIADQALKIRDIIGDRLCWHLQTNILASSTPRWRPPVPAGIWARHLRWWPKRWRWASQRGLRPSEIRSLIGFALVEQITAGSRHRRTRARAASWGRWSRPSKTPAD